MSTKLISSVSIVCLAAIGSLATLAFAQTSKPAATVYASGFMSKAEKPAQFLIVSQADFNRYAKDKFWDQSTPWKKVNWKKNHLYAIHAGQCPTSGYEVKVNALQQSGTKKASIVFSVTRPAPGAIQAQHVTSPYAIILLPASVTTVAISSTSTISTSN